MIAPSSGSAVPDENVEQLQGEKNDHDKSKDKKSKSDRNQEACDTKEEAEIEGEIIETYNVMRSDDTTAHCA